MRVTTNLFQNPVAGVPWKTGPAFWSGAFVSFFITSTVIIMSSKGGEAFVMKS